MRTDVNFALVKPLKELFSSAFLQIQHVLDRGVQEDTLNKQEDEYVEKHNDLLIKRATLLMSAALVLNIRYRHLRKSQPSALDNRRYGHHSASRLLHGYEVWLLR